MLQLAAAFGLDAFDLDLFLLALLPALDPGIGRVYAYLQDDANLTYLTVHLALEVLCAGTDLSRLTRLTHFAPGVPLFHHGLLLLGSEPRALPTPLLSQGLGVDPAVVAWLLGDYQPHATLGAHVELALPHTDTTDELLAAEVWPQLAELGPGPDDPCLLRPGSGKPGCHGAPLCRAARPTAVDRGPAGAAQGGTMPATALRFALRDARLTGAIPHLVGLDVCLDAGTLPGALLSILVEHPGPVITSSRQPLARRARAWTSVPSSNRRSPCRAMRNGGRCGRTTWACLRSRRSTWRLWPASLPWTADASVSWRPRLARGPTAR